MSQEIDRLKVVLDADTARLNAGLRRAQSQTQSAFGSMRNMALGLGGVFAAAFAVKGIVGFGAASLRTAAGFERSMDVLRAASGATAQQMRILQDRAVALGADMTLPGTSAVDASEAMLELSKAGLSVNDVLGASKGVLQLSAAGQISNAEAATVAANALNAFHLDGKAATDVANQLANAANASSASVGDLAYGFQSAASSFSQAGFQIQDLNTALAIMSNNGIKGQDAGTSLKSALMSLQAPSGKAAKAMKAMGINIYDAQGRMKPFRDVVDIITRSTQGLTQAQRNQAFATIFGTDGIRAANIVFAAGTKQIDDMATKVTAQGGAAKMAGAQNRGLAGAMDALRSVMETVQLTFGRPFLKPFTLALFTLGDWISRHTADIQAFAEALAGGMVRGFTAAVSAGRWLIGTFQRLSTVMQEGGLLAVLQTLGASIFNWLAGMVPVVQAKLAAWGQALVGWVQPRIPLLLAQLGALLQQAGVWITNTGLPWLQAKLLAWATAFANWALQATPPMLARLGGLVNSAVTWLLTVGLPRIMTGLTQWINALAAVPTQASGPLQVSSNAMLARFGAWITDTAWPAIKTALGKWADAFVAWVAPLIPPLLAALGNLVLRMNIWAYTVALPAIVKKLGEWGLAFVQWVGPQIPPLLKELGSLLLQLNIWAYTVALPAIVAQLANWGRALLGWVLPQIPGLLGNMASLLGSLTNWVLFTGVPMLSRAMFSAASSMMQGFINGITAMAGAVINAIRSAITDRLPGFVKDALGIRSPSKLFQGFGENVMQGMAVGLQSGGRDLERSLSLSLRPVVTPDLRGVSGSLALAGAGASVSNHYNISGAMPGDVEREVARALRRVLR